MKKIAIVILSIIFLIACSTSNTPKAKVEAYLGRYVSMDDEVLAEMSTTIASENLSETNTKIYEDVLTRQYENIKYTVKDEKIDGDNSTVIVKLTVYDLYKSDNDALIYLNNNQEEFMTDGAIDEEKYNKYKLDKMLSTNETVDYEVEFYLNKKNGTWLIEEPDRITLEKIHGLYNYES